MTAQTLPSNLQALLATQAETAMGFTKDFDYYNLAGDIDSAVGYLTQDIMKHKGTTNWDLAEFNAWMCVQLFFSRKERTQKEFATLAWKELSLREKYLYNGFKDIYTKAQNGYDFCQY